MLRLKDGASFATAHALCASRDGPSKSGFLMAVPAKTRDIFARFITTWEKQILTRVIGIRKEN